jgi:hypothetical protein
LAIQNPLTDQEIRWNFGNSRSTSLSLDEFLAQKEADGVEFFAGKEPWLVGSPQTELANLLPGLH